VVTFDWSGDGVSSSIWRGHNGALDKVEFVRRPNSLGVFYAAFTQFLGFERGDEYKVMGLAAYAQPSYDLDRVLDVSGELYELNTDIINTRNRSLHQLVYRPLLANLLPGLQRTRHDKLERKHMELAASVQRQFERAVFNYIRRAVAKTGVRRLCIAGGGGLNCTANGKIVRAGLADEVYVPPFPNDTGCSYGAAAVLTAKGRGRPSSLTTSQLGPAWSNEQLAKELELLKCRASFEPAIEEVVAKKIADGSLVGWFQGGMEVGPRALGGRSILADPRDRGVKDRINKYVKFREDFRPFAPSVLRDSAATYFDHTGESPFMSFIAPVKTPDELPGITHVDGTARLQTVCTADAPYPRLLKAMETVTGYPVVLNTSFNYMGQPIVCTPKEAIYTFFGTGLDVLALGNWLVRK
jgi:carbamoyltransferase